MLDFVLLPAGPFIDDVAPPAQKTLWFAVLYLFPTVGIAAGYIFGGLVGPALGWPAPFFIQASVQNLMIPLQASECTCDTETGWQQPASVCMHLRTWLTFSEVVKPAHAGCAGSACGPLHHAGPTGVTAQHARRCPG